MTDDPAAAARGNVDWNAGYAEGYAAGVASVRGETLGTLCERAGHTHATCPGHALPPTLAEMAILEARVAALTAALDGLDYCHQCGCGLPGPQLARDAARGMP